MSLCFWEKGSWSKLSFIYFLSLPRFLSVFLFFLETSFSHSFTFLVFFLKKRVKKEGEKALPRPLNDNLILPWRRSRGKVGEEFSQVVTLIRAPLGRSTPAALRLWDPGWVLGVYCGLGIYVLHAPCLCPCIHVREALLRASLRVFHRVFHVCFTERFTERLRAPSGALQGPSGRAIFWGLGGVFFGWFFGVFLVRFLGFLCTIFGTFRRLVSTRFLVFLCTIFGTYLCIVFIRFLTFFVHESCFFVLFSRCIFMHFLCIFMRYVPFLVHTFVYFLHDFVHVSCIFYNICTPYALHTAS